MNSGLQIRDVSGVTVAQVTGRITRGEGPANLRETLRRLANEGHRRILLDLSGVTYLDSSGIGVLVASFATMANLGGSVKLLRLSSRVKDLLLLTKLYTVFEVYEEEASAILSF